MNDVSAEVGECIPIYGNRDKKLYIVAGVIRDENGQEITAGENVDTDVEQ